MFLNSPILLLTVIVAVQFDRNKELFEPNLYLVRAKALTYSYEGERRVRCTFEIEHVYVGSDSLKGEHFEAQGTLPGLGLGQFGNWTSPEIKKGEVSIWWITPRPREKKLTPGVNQKGKQPPLVAIEYNPLTMPKVLFPPTRKIEHKLSDSDDERTKEEFKNMDVWYNNVEKCSIGLERVYRVAGAKRLDLLKELGRTDAPMLQSWCLSGLESLLSKADHVGYLTDLASNYSLSLWIEPDVDDKLSELSPPWRKSATRVKMFERWMTGKLSDNESMRGQEECLILNTLPLRNYDGFPYPTFLRLLVDGLITDRRSEDFKNRLLGIDDGKPNDLASVDAGFNYLISQIDKSDPKRRHAAARLLIHLVPLCKAQRATVKSLLEDPSCKPIASQLKESLQQTASVLDGLSGIDGPEWKFGGEKKIFLWTRLLEVAAGPQAVRFIQEHVRPASAVDPDRVQKLISDLDHEEFRRREDASRQLMRMGLEAEPFLSIALAHTNSTEARRRLQSLLDQFKTERTIALRAIPILTKIGTPESRTLLEKLASGSPGSTITKEARKILETNGTKK